MSRLVSSLVRRSAASSPRDVPSRRAQCFGVGGSGDVSHQGFFSIRFLVALEDIGSRSQSTPGSIYIFVYTPILQFALLNAAVPLSLVVLLCDAQVGELLWEHPPWCRSRHDAVLGEVGDAAVVAEEVLVEK